MHAISSYRGNRPTNTPTNKPTNRQDRLQYTAPQLARSVTNCSVLSHNLLRNSFINYRNGPERQRDSQENGLRIHYAMKQETQLMLTNLRDAFIGQSRSPNIVPFHMLDIITSTSIQ